MFRETGWETLRAPDIAHDGETPMRSSYSDVFLEGEFEAAFNRNNLLLRTVLPDPTNLYRSIPERMTGKSHQV